MLIRQVIPLLLAHAEGKAPIEGRTRLQKMMFLLQQRYRGMDFRYNFHAYDYGPYSSILQKETDRLIRMKLLVESQVETPNVTKYRYYITKKGSELVESALANPKNSKLKLKEIYHDCATIKAHANDRNLEELLKEVYTSYPEYAKFSVFQF